MSHDQTVLAIIAIAMVITAIITAIITATVITPEEHTCSSTAFNLDEYHQSLRQDLYEIGYVNGVTNMVDYRAQVSAMLDKYRNSRYSIYK